MMLLITFALFVLFGILSLCEAWADKRYPKHMIKYAFFFGAIFLLFTQISTAQTYSLSPVAKQIFFGTNGNFIDKPLAGGKLYTYASGTTSPLVSYSDANGTPNTNPVTLDAAGFATIFLPGGVNYRFVMTDANGVQQWSQDNVNATQPNGQFTTLNSKDIESVKYADQFPGGDCGAKINLVDALILSVAGEIWVNQNCGTSWTTTATLTANHVLRFIQGGTYASSASPMIAVNGYNVSILGSNTENTILASSNTTADTIDVNSSRSAYIADLYLYPTGTHTAGSCINIVTSSLTHIERVDQWNCFAGWTVNGGAVTTINDSNNEVVSLAGTTLLLTGNGTDFFMHNVTAGSISNSTGQVGIDIPNYSGVWIHDVDFINQGIGLRINPTSATSSNMWFTNAAFDTNSVDGVRIIPGSGGIVSNVHFANSWSSSNSQTGWNINGTVGTITGIELSGNRSLSNANIGILVNGGSNINLTNNMVGGNSLGSSGTYAGISISGTTDFVVNGNISGKTGGGATTQSYGLQVIGSADKGIITANDLNNNVTGPISIGPIGNNITIANNLPASANSVVYTFLSGWSAPNGTQIFCSDCNSTCSAGSSTGRTCFRENGAWVH